MGRAFCLLLGQNRNVCPNSSPPGELVFPVGQTFLSASIHGALSGMVRCGPNPSMTQSSDKLKADVEWLRPSRRLRPISGRRAIPRRAPAASKSEPVLIPESVSEGPLNSISNGLESWARDSFRYHRPAKLKVRHSETLPAGSREEVLGEFPLLLPAQVDGLLGRKLGEVSDGLVRRRGGVQAQCRRSGSTSTWALVAP